MESTIETTAWQQVAEVELTYKTKVKPSDRPKITSSRDGAELLQSFWDQNKIEFIEQFKIILLNRRNKVLGIMDVSSGGISGTVADPKVIFVAALKANACGLILSHNHPSGDMIPSKADQQLTQQIRAAGEFLDIKVLDHIIITTEGYFSFADEGLL